MALLIDVAVVGFGRWKLNFCFGVRGMKGWLGNT